MTTEAFVVKVLEKLLSKGKGKFNDKIALKWDKLQPILEDKKENLQPVFDDIKENLKDSLNYKKEELQDIVDFIKEKTPVYVDVPLFLYKA